MIILTVVPPAGPSDGATVTRLTIGCADAAADAQGKLLERGYSVGWDVGPLPRRDADELIRATELMKRLFTS